MTTLSDLLHDRAGLDWVTIGHLQLLLADWQILADLSFADLLLFVPLDGSGERGYLCVGQMRPYTAQTIYQEDLVGEVFERSARPMIGRALAEERVIRDSDPDWSTGVPVREEAIPVRMPAPDGRLVAVVTREANVATARSPSQLELTYLQSAGELAQMLADGTFPFDRAEPLERGLSPRVGDGIMRLDADGRVVYASPNAVSAYRRLGTLGNVVGEPLEAFDPGGSELADALRAAQPAESEVDQDPAVILRRLLPLLGGGAVVGGLLLVREVSDLRRRERALRVKEATIREIHHRVKNNLQTVASLLRLQARRLHSEEARAELAESVRRISSIALVHETLSQESRQRVEFGHVAQRIVTMLSEGLTNPEVPVAFDVAGDPGELPAEVATPLALVLTELLQNCVEHAFPPERQSRGGTVLTSFERGVATLRVRVSDDGVGLPEEGALEGFKNLGLQIVHSLVESELGGTFRSMPGEPDGTVVELVLPLPERP